MIFFAGNLCNQRIISVFTPIEVVSEDGETSAQAKRLFYVDNKVFVRGSAREKSATLALWNLNFDLLAEKPKSINAIPQIEHNLAVPEEIAARDVQATEDNVFILAGRNEGNLIAFKKEKENNGSGYTFLTKELIPSYKVTKLVCGTAHAIALTNKGVAFSWGKSENGRLGQGKSGNIEHPQLMYHLLSYHVTDIAVGGAHNVAICVEKRTSNLQEPGEGSAMVFTWGEGAKGALGNGATEDVYIPTKLNDARLSRLKEVSCGTSHTAFLTTDGELFTCGSNSSGQLGVGIAAMSAVPRKVSFQSIFEEESPIEELKGETSTQTRRAVARIFVGPSHMFCLSVTGRLYSWGAGMHGQLAGELHVGEQMLPRHLNKDSNLSKWFAEDSLSRCLFSRRMLQKSVSQLDMVLAADKTFLIFSRKITELAKSAPNLEKEVSSAEVSEHNSSFLTDRQITPFARQENIPRSMTSEISPFSEPTLAGSRSDFTALKRSVISATQKREDDERLRRERKEREAKFKRKADLKRVWLEELLPNWFEVRSTFEVRKWAAKGIPTALREKVWCMVIGNRHCITRDIYNIHRSSAKLTLKKLATGRGSSSDFKEGITGSPDAGKVDSVRMIDLDLPRTFPNHAIFSENSPISQNLRDVLATFAHFRPDVGYVQGMSYLAAVLLLHMDEFKSFVCFCNLVCQPALLPIFLMDEQQIEGRMEIFRLFAEENIPNLFRHMEREGVSPKMYFFEWMLTLFSKVLDFDNASRVWDCFFFEGPLILFKTGIALLKLMEKDLLREDITGMMKRLKNVNAYIHDDDQFVQALRDIEVSERAIRLREALLNKFLFDLSLIHI
eukprot:TRINITY_DN378_c0_g1_i2.p1 TRINITY_DN378_c0_g1~~TRINITY_DN378_c0_g1_i2.p1  ORF type:complete len:841 (-),score=191.79 TRINITY_DN378_c0_g1_i2:81-2603(-)